MESAHAAAIVVEVLFLPAVCRKRGPMQEKIERIERLMRDEENRQDKDAAGVYIPRNMDAHIRKQAFSECLKILRDGASYVETDCRSQ